MSGIEFIPLGVGDAFSARYYSSCLALRAPGAVTDGQPEWLLIDCPHPIRKILREASASACLTVDIDHTMGVLLTHLHADHASGVEGYCYYSFFVVGRRPQLITHPDVAARLWSGHLAAGMETLMDHSYASREMTAEDYFDHQPLTEDRALTVGPFTIECRKTIHHIPTTALRISAGGRCLSYSADTAFDPDLIEWLKVGDLIIHETNYGVHTPYESLAGLPVEVRAKMRLIHYPDEFDRDASVIEPLRQGAVYRV